MGKRIMLFATAMSVVFSLLLAPGNGRAQTGPLKLGDEAPSFTLPSSQDKLVDYYADYYGKYHLIITFFPASFTPV
jgi:hypothetical protein